MEPTGYEEVLRLARIPESGLVWHCICAVTKLGVPERIADGGTDVSELARSVDVAEQPLFRVLRFLAVHGIVTMEAGRVSLTSTGRILRKDHPWTMWAVFGAAGAADVVQALRETIRTGRPAAESVFGTTFWDHLSESPPMRKAFDDLLQRAAVGLVTEGIPALPWPAAGTVADIGGGRGTLLAAALETEPGLRGILVDEPAALEQAQTFLSAKGLTSKCELRPGSLFEPAPRADIYLLAFVLHDWADDNARRILRSISINAPDNATLRIFERLVPDDNSWHASKMHDITMMLLTGGRERTIDELRDLIDDTGWKIDSTTQAHHDISMIEAVRNA